MSTSERIPYYVEVGQVLQLLAKQIYQTPLALLRENCQNAYDAVLMRRQRGQQFEPKIVVSIEPNKITVCDNGIGMTRAELEKYYWRAGASGKNNPEARAAGVVGTFGIGAMANFGIANALTVISESANIPERTICRALRDSLSTTDPCIDMDIQTASGSPGTTIIAEIPHPNSVNIREAEAYVSSFVSFLEIPVLVNGVLVSQRPLEMSVNEPSGFAHEVVNETIGPSLAADTRLVISRATQEVWLRLTNIRYLGNPMDGIILLSQGMGQIRTFRSKFALASAAVNSSYRFGGVANLRVLEPTAGREAITASSLQLLQTISIECDAYVSRIVAGTEYANGNTSFMDWVDKHRQYALCSNLQIRVEPGARWLSLAQIKGKTKDVPMNYYEGSDKDMIESLASYEKPLIVVSSGQPRRRCELGFLSSQCKMSKIEDAPTVLDTKKDIALTLAESGFAFRVVSILEADYFVNATVSYGKMSHGLPIFVDLSRRPINIVIDSDSSGVSLILRLYEQDIATFGGMAKDFVRSVVFPKIANVVPSSTKQGAEAFLRTIRQPRDVFEYEKSDQGSLADIWERYLEGKISMTDAARQSAATARTTVQSFDTASTVQASHVIPDVMNNQDVLAKVRQSEEDDLQAMPAISRLNIESAAKLLVIETTEPALKGFRCFVAVTDRARTDKGEFFLQPHRTEILWAGQKVFYVFQHHSGEFGLYYELQSDQIISETPGGRRFQTSTIMLRNRIYIPVPDEISQRFIPREKERKRFEVNFQLLYPDTTTTKVVNENKG